MTATDNNQAHPAELIPHPMLERMATKWDVLDHLTKAKRPDHAETLAEVRGEWAAFVADVKERGIIVPIKVALIKAKLTIVDGRHRCKAALEAGLKQVPIERVPEDQALALMESTMIGRQHLTKGQRAYAAVVLHPEVATEGDKREGGNRKVQSPRTECGVIEAPQLAAKFGVSLRLIEQAGQLYRELDASKTLRAKHEWRVFAGFGLGAILAGLAGDESTSGKPRAAKDNTITKALSPLNGFWNYYRGLKGEAKDNAFTDAVALLSARQDFEFVEFMAELSAEAIKQRAEQLDDEGEGES